MSLLPFHELNVILVGGFLMTINSKLLLPSLTFKTFTDSWPYPSSFPDNKQPQVFSSIIVFYLQILLHPFLLEPSSAWSTLSVLVLFLSSSYPVAPQISSEGTQLSSTAQQHSSAAKLQQWSYFQFVWISQKLHEYLGCPMFHFADTVLEVNSEVLQLPLEQQSEHVQHFVQAGLAAALDYRMRWCPCVILKSKQNRININYGVWQHLTNNFSGSDPY